MKYINSDYLAVFWLKKRMRHYSFEQGARLSLESIKKTIRTICKIYCESHLYQNKKNKLILPDSLITLPCTFYSFMRSLLMSDRISSHPNEFEDLRRWVVTASVPEILNRFHPKIYELSDLDSYAEYVEDSVEYENMELVVPRAVPLKRSLIKEDSLYLVDDGLKFFVLIGKNFNGLERYLEGINFGDCASLTNNMLLDAYLTYDTKVGMMSNKLVDHLNTVYNSKYFSIEFLVFG